MVAALELEIPWGQQKPPYGTKLNASHPLIERGVSLILPFSEGAGKTVWDARGNSLTGTLNGGVTWAPSSRGIVLKGDGTSGYVNVANGSDAPQGSKARTLACWANLNAIASGNNSALVTQVPTTGGNQGFTFQVALLAGSTYIFTDSVNGGNNVTISGAQIPSLGVWHHLAFVFDGALGWKYYLDGEPSASGSFAVAINTVSSSVKIGGRTEPSNTGYIDGKFDQPPILPYALTAAQVADLYANPWGMFAPRRLRMPGGGTSGLLLKRRRAAA